MKKPCAPFSFHPLLLAVFPALSLLAANIDQIRLWQGIRLLTVSLALGVLIYLGAWLALHRRGNAALVASLVLVALLTYGRLYDGLKEAGLSGETIVRHRYLIPACLALVAAGVVGFVRMRETAGLNRVLNVVSVVAVAFPLIGIVSSWASGQSAAGARQMECTLQPPEGRTLPDVYVIIPDAYTRGDVLQEVHGFDNSAFLESLEAMGFYVARGSMSNFRPTEMSVSSMLNMAYVQDFPDLFGVRSKHRWDVLRQLRHGRVRQELECLGYATVAIETGYFDDWVDADYYLKRRAGAYSGLGFTGEVTRIEYIFLKTTAGRAWTDGWTATHADSSAEKLDGRADHRELILFSFDQLHEIPALPSPKLVYVHIFSPHTPYVFGPNGEPVSKAEFETELTGEEWESQAYTDQVAYINKLLLDAIGSILEQSEEPPIIVLMGDHGTGRRGLEEQMSNLNAYHVPDSVELYPTITPVNSFRVIFDGVFGGSYGTLPDVSYYSSGRNWFELTVVPNTWRPGSP